MPSAESFVPIATQLQQLVEGAKNLSLNPNVPPGFKTFRVQKSLGDLVGSLQQLVSLAAPISHVITPEPEPALAVLGINPNAVFLSALPLRQRQRQLTLTIVGTGFDVGATSSSFGMTISFKGSVPGQVPTNIGVLLNGTSKSGTGPATILSDNLAFVTLDLTAIYNEVYPTGANTPVTTDLGLYNVTITMTNRNQVSRSLLTGFNILP